MTKKAYIVANEQQERELLYKLEQEDLTWWGGDKLTKWTPSRVLHVEFPYILLAQETIVTWSRINEVSGLEKYEIAFDGRKEEQMSDKYVVSQEFMNELEDWKKRGRFVSVGMLSDLPDIINNWRITLENNESNNRLIAIIRWVNGGDVFEVEKPKKWVVHELNTKLYVTTWDGHTGITSNWDYITKFNTKEEAESWANSHQEVIEVEQ